MKNVTKTTVVYLFITLIPSLLVGDRISWRRGFGRGLFQVNVLENNLIPNIFTTWCHTHDIVKNEASCI